jgi:hypothetical protein
MSIAFKEWAIVCAALGRGEQSIILRKGGIAEGREGFRFKHAEFYLFPTLFHEQIEKTTLPPGTPIPAPEPGMVRIELLARVEWTASITALDVARRLAPHHIWKDEVVAERFHYDEKEALHLAFTRIYRLAHPWIFPDEPRYGGCRSWVEIPDVPGTNEATPVLGDAANKARSDEVRGLLAGAT